MWNYDIDLQNVKWRYCLRSILEWMAMAHLCNISAIFQQYLNSPPSVANIARFGAESGNSRGKTKWYQNANIFILEFGIVVEKSHSEFFSFYRSKRRFTNIVQDFFVFETLLFDGKVSRHTIEHQRWNFLLTWICSLDGMNDSHSISSTNAKTIQKIASWDYLRFLGKLSADYLQFSDDLYLKPCWRWQRQFQGYPEHFAKHVRRVMCLHHRSYADCTHVKYKHKNTQILLSSHVPPILHKLHKSRSRCGFVIESN